MVVIDRYCPIQFGVKKKYEKIVLEQQFLYQTIAYGHRFLFVETPMVLGLTIFSQSEVCFEIFLFFFLLIFMPRLWDQKNHRRGDLTKNAEVINEALGNKLQLCFS